MHVFVADTQPVGEQDACLFEVLQQGPVVAQFFLANSGINMMAYRFQEFNGTTWVDMGVPGSPLNSTLLSGETKSIGVSSGQAKIRLRGNASGGSILQFSITRWFNRPSGGPIPILSL